MMTLRKGTAVLMLLGLCVLSLCILAPASYGEGILPFYSISDLREQAASGWHQTYEAHGRSIVVDISIQVPEVNSFPALVAIPMPALEGMPLTDENGYNLGSDKFFNKTGFFRWDTPAREITSKAAQKNQKNPPRGMDVKPVIRRFNELDWDAAYSFNNPATVRDADQWMKVKWEEYFPGEAISLTPHWVHGYGEMRKYDRKTDTYSREPWPDFQGPLMVYFDQVVRGVPLLGHVSETFTQYSGPVRKETRGYVGGIAIIKELEDIGLEETFYSMQYSLMKERAELAADVPLCGVDQAIAAYEKLILDGKLRRVDSLRLGYVLWRNKGEEESYTLLPTWVLEGELFKDGDADYRMPMTQSATMALEYGPILVNAQAGELVNPWNTRLNRSFEVPEVVRWE